MKRFLWFAIPLLTAGGLLSCGEGTADIGAPLDDALSSDTAALCTVQQQELIANQLSVVEDPVRTTWAQDPNVNPKAAAWTFGRLMQQMAGANDPSDFTEELFKRWEVNQTINSFVVPARTGIDTFVLNSWPRLSNGKLDLTKAPLRLLAIVNRLDLRKLSQGNAGEGRFVFGVLDSAGNALSFTVILEYKLPAATQADVIAWADRWHALGSLSFPSSAYNDALQNITDLFAGAGVAPTKPNGSSISQIRSNEIALSFPWQLREFHLATTGHLVEATVANAPDRGFNGTATLASFVNGHAAALIAGKQSIPMSFNNAPFRGGAVFNQIDFWNAPGIIDNNARFGLSVNTCNGCHGRETSTSFLQIAPRAKGAKAAFSGFLTGIDVIDPVDGVTSRHFADLTRRANDLASVACAASPSQISFESGERVH